MNLVRAAIDLLEQSLQINRSAGTSREICKFDQSGPVAVGPDLTHLAFEVDDLEKFAREAAAKGYPLSDGPHSTGSSKIAFVDAPEGYEVELIERATKS